MARWTMHDAAWELSLAPEIVRGIDPPSFDPTPAEKRRGRKKPPPLEIHTHYESRASVDLSDAELRALEETED